MDMKLKRISTAVAAIAICCASMTPIMTADNSCEAVTVSNAHTFNAPPAVKYETQAYTGMTASADNIVKASLSDSVNLTDVKPVTETAVSVNAAAASDTADDDVIVITPTIEESSTTTFSAKVFDDTNDPNHTKNESIGAGYTITLTKTDGTFETSAKTDANGCIKIEDVPAGTYTAKFSGDNGSATKYMDTSSPVTLKANVGMTMTFYTKSVSDRAMLKFAFCKCVGTTPDTSVKYAVAGAIVKITNTSTKSTYTGESDANGIVSFKNIDPGAYTFTVVSMPTGYKAAVSSGSVSGITEEGQKTMNVPTYVDDTLGELKVTFNTDPWIIVADGGYADQSLIEYGLCKYTNGSMETVKTYTYDEVVKGVTYTFSANDRTSSWYFEIINPEICGFVSAGVPLTEISSAETKGELLYNVAIPKVVTNAITVKADPNTNICICPQNSGRIGDYDTATAQIKKTDENGEVTFDSVPFGEFFVIDMSTDTQKPITVKTDGKTQLVEMPSKSECYVLTYTLYDMYGDLVGVYDGQLEDVKKPESQGDRNAIYTVVCEAGNPYSSIGTAIMQTIVRIDADGTVTDFGGGKIGDGDCDGKFDIEDVKTLQQWLLAVPDTHIEFWQMVDFDCNDRLDVFDLCFAKRILLKDVNAALAAEKEAAEASQQ